jgi:glyoxylase-like metal-dependent hydrolase (beta-lactamase superfamily II)
MKIRGMVLGLLGVSFHVQAWTIAGVGEFQFDPVAKQVYVMHGPLGHPNKTNQGFMNNPGLVVGAEGLVLIDPGSTRAVGKQVLNEVAKISTKPIVAVFNTHIHGDHWLGNQAVKEAWPDVKIYAHPQTIQQATDGEGQRWLDLMNKLTEGLSAGTTLVPATLAINAGDELTIGGEVWRFHGVSPAHTDSDIMIEHVASKTLFMGDNGFNLRVGRFDGSSDMHGNMAALELAAKLDLWTYVPGHGASGTQGVVVKPFLHYLNTLKRVVSEGYANDQEPYEIKGKAATELQQYKGWNGFEDELGRHISKLYLEIEARDL